MLSFQILTRKHLHRFMLHSDKHGDDDFDIVLTVQLCHSKALHHWYKFTLLSCCPRDQGSLCAAVWRKNTQVNMKHIYILGENRLGSKMVMWYTEVSKNSKDIDLSTVLEKSAQISWNCSDICVLRVYFLLLLAFHNVSTTTQWLELMPQIKKVLGSTPSSDLGSHAKENCDLNRIGLVK